MANVEKGENNEVENYFDYENWQNPKDVNGWSVAAKARAWLNPKEGCPQNKQKRNGDKGDLDSFAQEVQFLLQS